MEEEVLLALLGVGMPLLADIGIPVGLRFLGAIGGNCFLLSSDAAAFIALSSAFLTLSSASMTF